MEMQDFQWLLLIQYDNNRRVIDEDRCHAEVLGMCQQLKEEKTSWVEKIFSLVSS